MSYKVKWFWRKAQEIAGIFWRWLIGIAVDITKLIAFYNAIKPYLPKLVRWGSWLLFVFLPESGGPSQ